MVKFGLKFIYFSFFRCLIEKADLKDTRVFLPKKTFHFGVILRGNILFWFHQSNIYFETNLHRKTSEFVFLPQP